MSQATLYKGGCICHCTGSLDNDLDDSTFFALLENHAIIVNDDTGLIEFIGPEDTADKITDFGELNVVTLDKHEYLVPGFIDTHIHAPQYSYTGTATDVNLMQWLSHYTFPAEKEFENITAETSSVYEKIVSRTLASGTTTAMYFGTIHVEACKVLAKTCRSLGQRAFIGKVCMDRHSPNYYFEKSSEALAGTEEFIKFIQDVDNGDRMLFPVITPRFIPTCSSELLTALGGLVRKYNCHVQSHISESLDEVEVSATLHPGEGSDTQIFDKAGLLTSKSMMAHGVHLTDADLDLLKERGTSIAHCPLSNFYFAHGYLPTIKLLQRGINVGLGTDVAGGYSPSMLNAQRMAVIASLAGSIQAETAKEREHMLNYKQAFYLATLGGARALQFNEIGNFEIGKRFDALVLSANEVNIDLFRSDTKEDIFQKICNLGDDRNVKKVYVQGKLVCEKS